MNRDTMEQTNKDNNTTDRTEQMNEKETGHTTTNGDQSRPHLRIEELRKTFDGGEIVACDDVNIDIQEGEFVVLVGPSGCGKTTTLRCIAGLEDPDEGMIYVNNTDITGLKSKDRDLAFVFQSIALFPHMSVRKNMRFGLDMNTDLPKDEKNNRVEEVAAMLGLEEMLDRKPSALSGGQQQRVSLGRAMVMEPEAFLLDEPFSALDANLRDQMRVEVKKIQRELNTPMVFVTHDQEEAMTLGDQIVVMNAGHVQQIGTPHEIYNDPQTRFVADFIGSPSPNLIECTVNSTDDGLVFENDIFRLPATDSQVAALKDHIGKTIVLGIRPEYLNFKSGDNSFSATVDVIEPLGDRDAVHLSANEISLSAITPQGEISRDTEQVNITVQTDHTWVFDLDGERVI